MGYKRYDDFYQKQQLLVTLRKLIKHGLIHLLFHIEIITFLGYYHHINVHKRHT